MKRRLKLHKRLRLLKEKLNPWCLPDTTLKFRNKRRKANRASHKSRIRNK